MSGRNLLPRSTVFSSRSLRSGICLLAWLASIPCYGQSRFNDDAQAFGKTVQKLLLDKKYDELDQLAKELRKDRPLLLTGRPKLLEFYDSASSVADERGNRSEKTARDRLQLVKNWHEVKPSPTSRLVLVATSVNLAWAARGGGWASTISPEGQAIIESAVLNAHELLQEGREEFQTLDPKDPYYQYWAMKVGILGGYPRELMDQLAEEALAIDPHCTAVIDTLSQYALPRWYGEEGDLLKLADSLSKNTHAQTGDMAYALVAVSSLQANEFQTFSQGGFEWPRVKAGLEVWLKPSPDSPYRLSVLANYAYLADDRETSVKALEKLKGRWHTAIFSRPVDYHRVQTWAEQDPDRQDDARLVVQVERGNIPDFIFALGGDMIVCAPHSGSLEIHSTKDGSKQTSVPFTYGSVNRLATDAAGKVIFFAADRGSDSMIVVLDLEAAEMAGLGEQEGFLQTLNISADQRYIALGTNRGQLRRWENSQTPVPYEWSFGSKHPVADIAFSPDSRFLMAVSDREGKIWNLETRKEWKAWTVHNRFVRTVAWSPKNQKLVATAGHQNEVTLWDPSETKEIGKLKGGNTSIETLTFSPDGKYLIGGTMAGDKPETPGQVLVWDVESRKLLKTLKGHLLGIWQVRVSPDGKTIASCSEDGTVRLWDLP